MSPDRRTLLLGLGGAAIALPARAQAEPLELTGRFQQGGHAIGQTWPRALIFVDGEALTAASANGAFIVGFDREAASSV